MAKKFLLGLPKAVADAKNHAIAIKHGAGKPGDVTQFWVNSWPHQTSKLWALEIPDSEEKNLGDLDKPLLKDEKHSKDNGWFDFDIKKI